MKKPVPAAIAFFCAASAFPLFGAADDFSSTYVKYESPNRGTFGWRTADGELVVPAMFDDVGEFSCGRCVVKLGGLYGYFDYEGMIAAPVRFLEAGTFRRTKAGTPYAEVRDAYGWNFIDEFGIPVFPKSKAKKIADAKTLGLAEFYLDSRAILRADDACSETFSDYAQRSIGAYLSFWYPKNEYETTDDWRARTSPEKVAAKLEELQRIALARFTADRGEKTPVPADFKILKYDADNSAFLLRHKKFGAVVVPVPRKDSAAFRNGFASAKLSSPEYAVGKNDLIMLKGLEIELPDGRTYSADPARVFELAKVLPGLEIELPAEGGTIDIPPRPADSDADNDIPENAPQPERRRFVCIIANESYEHEADVLFAGNDGFIFRRYCEKTLGVPAENIVYRKNASLAQMNSAIADACRRADAFPNSELIFYYAGHGVPVGKARAPHLLPADCRADDAEKGGLDLARFYEILSDSKAESVLVFLDAGFDGSMRDGASLSKGGRVPRMEPESGTPLGRTIVFAAASGRESANQFAEKSHGMFTYFLLKKMQESRGNVALGELAEYLEKNVRETALLKCGRPQTPTTAPAEDVPADWESRLLK